jgi:hypothetical protein
MSQSWHPEDSDWREGPEDSNSAASPCIVLERPFVVPVIFPQKKSDPVVCQPHIVLACSAYDDDEDYEE